MLDFALLIILFFLAFLAFGLSRQFFQNKKLKSEFLDFESQKLIFTDLSVSLDHLTEEEDVSIIEVKSPELVNSKSFTRRIMQKTGVQMLPMEVWLSEQGNLMGKPIR